MEDVLHQAEQLENSCDWLGAARLFEKARSMLPEDDFSRIGDNRERLGYAYYHFAFQARTNAEFRERLSQSASVYGKAVEYYGRKRSSADAGRVLRCNAMVAFIGYWIGSEAPEKKRLIDECWRLACDALKAFEEAGEESEYGRTFNQFSRSADLSFCLEQNWQIREKVIREAIKHGEQAIKHLSRLGKDNESAKAYVKTADYLYALGYAFLDRADQERQFEKARSYWQKARGISEEMAFIESLSVMQGLMLEFGAGAEETLRLYERALEYGKRTADSYVVGYALEMLAYHTGHKAWNMTEDPDEMVKLGEKGLQYAAEAKQQYSKISFVSPGYGFLWVEAPYAEYYCVWASRQTDPNKRHELVNKAAESGPELLERAVRSGYPDTVWYAHHVIGKILTLSARIETDPELKKNLLEEALQHRKEVLKGFEQVPSMYWERGVTLVGTGEVKAQLADLASDSETKRKLLLEAVEDGQESFRLLTKGIISLEKEDSMVTVLGYTQYQCGLLLNHVYEFTHNKEHLTKAAEAFEEAAGYYGKFGYTGRVAECHWKVAQTYSLLDEHLKAAEYFGLASDSYNKATEKIILLKDFYQSYALYMQAWAEIEKARHHHEKREYGQAKEYFEKAAALHVSSNRWSYLQANYSAWALVEDAEELSRKEQSQEASEAFNNASRLFVETKKAVQTQLNVIEDNDERQMAKEIVEASGLRKQYCDARVAVEEAKILDKKGDHFGSSRKYGEAVETLERIFPTLESEREREEFKTIITLSRAWQKMMLGDARASPESYLEASALFEQASKESDSEVTSLLALGHSRFCKALEAGTRFADTGEASLQGVAVKNLDAAAKYYVTAGFQSASEYAKATSFLFDAYVHMDAAKEERDPEKKTKLYLIAEKVLQTSAGSFMKAEHPEKREQVLRLLEKVREERELALSIAEVLHTPPIVSTTTSFSALTPKSEEAVGSEMFEHANIHANLIVRRKELKVGESLDIELELVNVGNGSALLTKVADIIPKGFLVAEGPETCRVEDSYINFKGKRLDPLKSEEVTFVLKPTLQGTFSLKPTVLYLDENGKYKSFEPEPVVIAVKELGIKSWLKGER